MDNILVANLSHQWCVFYTRTWPDGNSLRATTQSSPKAKEQISIHTCWAFCLQLV